VISFMVTSGWNLAATTRREAVPPLVLAEFAAPQRMTRADLVSQPVLATAYAAGAVDMLNVVTLETQLRAQARVPYGASREIREAADCLNGNTGRTQASLLLYAMDVWSRPPSYRGEASAAFDLFGCRKN
jgi:hypothetical protein